MDRLPVEIFHLINKHIHEYSTLINLILCSRRLHSIFLPLIYGYRPLDLEFYRNSHKSHSYQKVMIQFIHNICRHRVVARSIYQLTCVASGFDFDTSSDATFVDPDVVLDRTLIKGVLDEICDTEQEKSKWMSHLAAANKDAWTGLLLTRLSNLEIIHISAPDEDSYFVQQIVYKAARREPPFDRRPLFPVLREVKMGVHEEDNFDSGYLTLPFCYFPSVQKIIAGQIKDRVSRHKVFDVPEATCPTRSVTEIRVLGCLDNKDLDKWIAVCNNLETFKLSFGYYDLSFDTWRFKPYDLRNSLLQANKTLKTLWLGFDEIYYEACYRRYRCRYVMESYENGIEKDDFPFGSLKEFLALQTLCIRHANLLLLPNVSYELDAPAHDLLPRPLHDLLPRSLENLHIMDIHPKYLRRLMKELTKLVYKHEFFVPLLKNLTFDQDTCYGWMITSKEIKDWMGPLEEACHKNGISIHITGCANCSNVKYPSLS